MSTLREREGVSKKGNNLLFLKKGDYREISNPKGPTLMLTQRRRRKRVFKKVNKSQFYIHKGNPGGSEKTKQDDVDYG